MKGRHLVVLALAGGVGAAGALAHAPARAAAGLPAPAGVAAVVHAPAAQEKKGPADDMNPRAPTTPLVVELEPFWCSECIAKKRLPPSERDIKLLHKEPELIAQQLGIKDGEWLVMKSPHFKIFSTIGTSTAKYDDSIFVRPDLDRLKTLVTGISFGSEGARLDAHQRMHLYHVRLERQYAHFAALTNNTQPNLGMPGMYEIYLFDDYTRHHDFCDRYIGGRQDKGGVQWHVQEKPNFILLTVAESVVAAQTAKGDGALANHVYHNVAHLLIDGYNNYFRETPAWIEEGLGHYYERRENPRWNNFCWAEGQSPSEFTKPDWEAIIFTMVRRQKDPPFAQWCEKLQPGELTGVENGLSWSIVRWLVEHEPVRFTKMLEPMDDLQRNLKPSELIEQAFGCSATVLAQRWRDHVLAEYAKK